MTQSPLIPHTVWKNSVAPPLLAVRPTAVRRLIRRLRTPLQVQRWVHSLRYNPRDTMYGLAGVVRDKRAHCLEAALSAATILEHRGYPPLILDLESADRLDHTLFLYRQRGKYGSIGISRDVGLAGRKSVYPNIRSLVQSYAAPYIDAKANITAYGVFDLRQLKRQDWRTSAGNVWYVEEALRNFPHRRLNLSPEYVWHWRQKFLLFRRAHPGEQPPFYRQQHHWA